MFDSVQMNPIIFFLTRIHKIKKKIVERKEKGKDRDDRTRVSDFELLVARRW